LSGANLSNSSLIGADLVHARLDGTDFSCADLTDAILDYADLTGAKLDGAILIGTSFANARWLTEAQISSAYGNASTTLPDYLQPPKSWFPDLDDDIFYNDETPGEPIHESNPYQVLGVDVSATPDEIRTAFRNLVKQVHPDLNPGDQDALETFKRVSIAYGILGNANKRRRYDRGEIGGDGDITQEFEAKQQFRRYAYRFYAAAAASLFVAVGVLSGVWHMVLTDDTTQTNRVEITVTMPPKKTERLGSEPDTNTGKPSAIAAESSDPKGQYLAENPVLPAEALDAAVPVPDTASPETAAPDAISPDAASAKAALPDITSAEAHLTEDDSESEAENAAIKPSADTRESEPRPETAQEATAAESSDPKGQDLAENPVFPAEALDAAVPNTASSEAVARHAAAPDTTFSHAASADDGSAQARLTADEPESEAENAAIEPSSDDPEDERRRETAQDVAQDIGDRQALADEKDASGAEDRIAANGNSGEDAAKQRNENAEPAGDEINESAPPSVPTSSEIKLSDIPATNLPQSLDAFSKDQGKGDAGPMDTRSANLTIHKNQPAHPDALARHHSENDLKGKNNPSIDQPNAYSLHSDLLLRKTKARKIAPDSVSDILRRRAIKKMLPNWNAEATASFDALTDPNTIGEQEEIWDIYTHSLPDDQNRTEARPWPEMLAKKKEATNVSLSAPPRPVATPVRPAAASNHHARRPPIPDVSLRQQAISEILAGGL
jgi:hypothetical protein